MVPKRSYNLVYAPLFKEHLKAIEAKYYSLIRSEIETFLLYEPDKESRNRKPLKRPIILGTEWEIRIGPGNRIRVFYKVYQEISEVRILAIGEKKGNRLFIGGEEVKS